MQVELIQWINSEWNKSAKLVDAQLVIYFAGKKIPEFRECYHELENFYPSAHIIGCSTGGEIFGDEVSDDSISVAAIRFERTTLKTAVVSIENANESFEAGKKIAQDLAAENLSNVFLLSDGIHVNGSELVRGMYEILDKHTAVTGGLAGDGSDFRKTLVGVDFLPESNVIAAVGFYGSSLNVGYGSVGGWDAFGPKRLITKARGNVLYELDGQPALDLYKKYLGADAEKLPSSALLFPLSVHPTTNAKNTIVRTVVGVNEQEKTMTFAGDVPEGYVAQLMRGDFDNLVEGAEKAAGLASFDNKSSNSLAILVSCIGRKMLLGQRISDETEAVADVFNHNIPTIGFYSYGEICHQRFTGDCSLHNQTMTVTLIYESE
jgi:hypothetical protein